MQPGWALENALSLVFAPNATATNYAAALLLVTNVTSTTRVPPPRRSWRRRANPHLRRISPHLPASPRISPHLPTRIAHS